MKIFEPPFTPTEWIFNPAKTYVTQQQILPAGNISWWSDINYVRFIWETPGILPSHGWWINAIILRGLGSLIADKLTDGSFINVDETHITHICPTLSPTTIVRARSKCASDVTRGYIIANTPQRKPPSAITEITDVVCTNFHTITNFHSIYPRTLNDNF